VHPDIPPVPESVVSEPEMEALEFRHEIPRYLATRALYAASRRLWSARWAPLHHVRRARPQATRAGWVRLGVRLSGICGSDLNLVTARDSLYLEPEATYPFIPGHELVGDVARDTRGPSWSADAGDSFSPGESFRASPGDRVAVWPVIGCRARGQAACPACAEGWDGLCEQRSDSWPGAGLAIGFNRETGGGWSEACLAHESQLWRLPESVSDEDAVLLDPSAAALACLLRTGDPAPDKTLVIGGGTIGLLTAWLHSALGLPGECELIVRYDTQRESAVRLGVNATALRDTSEFRAWASDRGITSRRVPGYGHVFRGNADRVIDTAGTTDSVQWSLAAVRPRGQVVLATSPASLRGVDPTPIWYREIRLRGIDQYGPVSMEGTWVHPFTVLIPLVASGKLPLRQLVTHVFPLAEYVTAFETVTRRRSTGAIKVAFRARGH
jgi:threonine dehydrogenase-like Zn-dependent dehydrogenase